MAHENGISYGDSTSGAAAAYRQRQLAAASAAGYLALARVAAIGASWYCVAGGNRDDSICIEEKRKYSWHCVIATHHASCGTQLGIKRVMCARALARQCGRAAASLRCKHQHHIAASARKRRHQWRQSNKRARQVTIAAALHKRAWRAARRAAVTLRHALRAHNDAYGMPLYLWRLSRAAAHAHVSIENI